MDPMFERDIGRRTQLWNRLGHQWKDVKFLSPTHVIPMEQRKVQTTFEEDRHNHSNINLILKRLRETDHIAISGKAIRHIYSSENLHEYTSTDYPFDHKSISKEKTAPQLMKVKDSILQEDALSRMKAESRDEMIPDWKENLLQFFLQSLYQLQIVQAKYGGQK
ncbi:MAG: hypothetical protein EZS28_005372 [Streblomastix strix]|uniref:Uncharacterized protein n=1 Tax=Streblomastix strix TaxID=222440 RepID=A0A5J4WVQ1_9EUKA|nr:MAG: hypothetical protein EZS28_005372 [Streblomastix strix]